MDEIILDNSVRSYLWAAGVIFFVLVLNRLISKYFIGFLSSWFRRIWKDFDEVKFKDLIVKPLGIFLVIAVTIATLYRLNFPSTLNFLIYKYPFSKVLLSIAIIVQLVVFTWLLLRVVDYIAYVLEKRSPEHHSQGVKQVLLFFRDFLKVILLIIGFLLILKFAFGYNIGALLTGLSIVGAAIALAMKESLENLIASFIIFFDKPFTTGDFVKVNSFSGTVERIGLRSTRLRTADKSYVTVPNKQMVDSIVDNVSMRSQIRGVLNIYLDLETTPAKIEGLSDEIRSFIAAIPEISSSTVLLNDIKTQGYLLFIEFFTPPIPWTQFTEAKQKINYFILRTMERMEIKIGEANREV